MVNKSKVLHTLSEWTDEPTISDLCANTVYAIDTETPAGKLIMRLLRFAEMGDFK